MTAITVYSKPNCPNCTLTKRALDRAALGYSEVNLMENASALEKVKQAGFMAAPVVMTDEGDAWSGFRPDLIRKLKKRVLG